MLTEAGRIVAIDADRLWVETINRSTCGSCAAEKGCGQSLLARWMERTRYLPVRLDGRDPSDFKLNDIVTLGIAEDVVLKSSLLIYCLPLLTMLAGIGLASNVWAGEGGAIAGAFIGLIVGGLAVKWHAHYSRHNRRLRPVLLEPLATQQQADATPLASSSQKPLA